MEFYLLFPFFPLLAFLWVRAKKIQIGDFIDIRWNDQPIQFLSFILLVCLCAVDSFCGILSMFGHSIISDEDLKILDGVTAFLISFVSLAIFVLVKKLTIKKKVYTWKETPLVRSSFVVFFLALSVLCAKGLIRGIL